MNRGRGRHRIFHGPAYYEAFLQTLGEACSRFGLEVHAYCLMGNHYHLFVRTPRANLDRCMRHINGIYTQRYNRLEGTDGPLFRGRYKAVLVEADSYGLQLSRYIHRNPVELKAPLVERLEDYPWSSYPAYIGKAQQQAWLSRSSVYSLHGGRARAYQQFVECGNDEDILDFYGKGNLKAVLGTDAFVDRVAQHSEVDAAEFDRTQQRLPSIDTIVSAVARHFAVSQDSIRVAARGRGQKNVARWVALSLCREAGGHGLDHIARAFNMGHISGVGGSVRKLKSLLNDDYQLRKRVAALRDDLMLERSRASVVWKHK
jgi:putative transposase